MDIISKRLFLLKKGGLNILIVLFTLFFGIFPSLELIKKAGAQIQLSSEEPVPSEFLIIQGNSLQSTRNHLSLENEIMITGQIEVIVTGYSSSPWETDDTPYLTAAGTSVREGIVATNLLSFGTKIRLPELFGDQIFIVEDRMSLRKDYHIDIWFSSYWEALNFGAKRTYIEIIQEA